MSEDTSSWFPGPIAGSLFSLISMLWAVSEVYNRVGPRLRRPAAGATQHDRGSYWVVALVVWGSMALSFLMRRLNIGAFHSDLQYLGLGLELVGIAFREWAVLSLGQFFTVVVTIDPAQTLITRGPYHWFRHPAYTGSILTLVGVPLALGTWAAALLVLVICCAGFLYRVQVEERVLMEVFGDEYRAYSQHTWRFLPGL